VPLAEEHDRGVAEHLAQPARVEMAEVARPSALRSVPRDELREYALDGPAGVDQPPRPGRPLVLSGLERRDELHAVAEQALARVRAPVRPLAERVAGCAGEYLGREGEAGDESRPRHAQVRPQPEERAGQAQVTAVSRDAGEEAALFGPREAADGPEHPIPPGPAAPHYRLSGGR
jgi:hypothetical protein